MISAVLIVAKVKGELKALWTYTETWTVKRDLVPDADAAADGGVDVVHGLYHDEKNVEALEDAVESAPAPPAYSS
ncbi:hypothetical protein ACM66B_001976 [Microbotryomycetes sp. NB124-2]